MAKLRLSDADMKSLAAIRRALQNLNHAVRALEVAAGITSADVQNWNEALDKANTAYSWGNHAQAGYLTTETDPIFSASPAAIIAESNIWDWNNAYSWGDHSAQNYVKGTESGLVIPTLAGNTHRVLSNDGSNLTWRIVY